jgi:hypothetical protein
MNLARRAPEIDLRDSTVGHVNIAHAIDVICRVDDVAVGDESRRH